MNNYKLSDIEVGLQHSFEYMITEEKMEAFCILCGDENPLHTDAEYAREKGYKDRVAYGMLTSSLISTMVGMYLPGKYSVLQSVESKFLQPVYAGDVLTMTAKVDAVSKSVGQVALNILVKNQEKKKVLKGKVKVLVLE